MQNTFVAPIDEVSPLRRTLEFNRTISYFCEPRGLADFIREALDNRAFRIFWILLTLNVATLIYSAIFNWQLHSVRDIARYVPQLRKHVGFLIATLGVIICSKIILLENFCFLAILISALGNAISWFAYWLAYGIRDVPPNSLPIFILAASALLLFASIMNRMVFLEEDPFFPQFIYAALHALFGGILFMKVQDAEIERAILQHQMQHENGFIPRME